MVELLKFIIDTNSLEFLKLIIIFSLFIYGIHISLQDIADWFKGNDFIENGIKNDDEEGESNV